MGASGLRPYVYVASALSVGILLWVYPRDTVLPMVETPIPAAVTSTPAPVPTSAVKQDPASIEIVETVKFQTGKLMMKDVSKYSPVRGTGCKDGCNRDKGWGKCSTKLKRCTCSLGRAGDDCGFSIKTLYPNSEVYEGLEDRPLDLQGWNDGGRIYEALVKALKPNLVVEVGVWKGNSGCAFGKALKDQGQGVYVGVDIWLPWASYWTERTVIPEKDWGFVNGWPTVFYTFLSNIKHKGLEQAMAPLPGNSQMGGHVVKTLHLKPDIVHIDGRHTYEDVKFDFELWWPLLRPGGVLLGDDWSTSWPGVMQAGSEFARKHGLQVKRYNDKFWMQKPLSG